MTGRAIALTLAVLCAGCTHSPARSLIERFGPQETVAGFDVCSDYGCFKRTSVSLGEAEWAEVRALFAPAPQGAPEERERIRQAVAMLETMIGPKAGTEHDEAGAAIINFDTRGQMDCIDEAYNTSTYLGLMAADHLLRFHDVGVPVRRGYILNRWPHNTATIADRSGSAEYAVDSWYHANGAMPDVVPLQEWLDGWHPPEDVQTAAAAN